MEINTTIDTSMVEQVCDGLLKRFDRQYFLNCLKERRFPTELCKGMAEAGLLGLGVPEEYGGLGGGAAEIVMAIETLARNGVTPEFWLLTGFVRNVILKHGTEEQKQKYVVPTARGELQLCFAMTEPNAGTNTFKIATTAHRTDNGSYLLNGQKVFISAINDSDYALVLTRTQSYKDKETRKDGLTLFLVDTKSPGIEVSPLNIGFASGNQFQVFFSNVEIPADAMIGKEGEGIKYLFDVLNPERMFISAQTIGLGEWILEKGVEYAKVRAPFDRPIGSYQSVQHPMAYAKAHLEAARLMLYKAVELYGKGEKVGPLANMAKLLSADARYEAVNATLQAHGGYGFDHDYDILDAFIMARLGQVAPVNNNMLLNYIAEHVLKLPKSY